MEPSSYGQGSGPYVGIEPEDVTLNLRDGGMDVSTSATALQEGQSPNLADVRVDQGGVSTDFGLSNFGLVSASAAVRRIMHITPFQLNSGVRRVVRLRPTKWDRWDGVSWLELGGTLTGGTGNLIYSAMMQGRIIAANGIDKLKSWDGLDASSVIDLSADSPIAAYLVRIGNRLMAARITVGGVINPNLVAWSADGLITDWTTALLGAGNAELQPEGPSKAAGFITGLSAAARSAVIYRQRAIQLATLTGIGSQPFRFQTPFFNHGTESPYSIASGGPVAGDYFLGHDFMVYHFDGQNQPTPIGAPVIDAIRDTIYDLAYVQGAVDTRRQEYWLGIPQDSGLTVKVAWIFSIKEWVARQRLVWRRRNLSAGYSTISFGTAPSSADPLVDSVLDLVDSVSRTPDSYALASGQELILFGDALGQVKNIDELTALGSGSWESKQFNKGRHDVTLEQIALSYEARVAGTVEVAVSTDGGASYQSPRVMNFGITGNSSMQVGDTFRVTGRLFQIRLRLLTGFVNITEIYCVLSDRGIHGN